MANKGATKGVEMTYGVKFEEASPSKREILVERIISLFPDTKADEFVRKAIGSAIDAAYAEGYGDGVEIMLDPAYGREGM